MRKLILKMSMSLDGFVSGPNGEEDWMAPSRSEDGAAWVLETLSQAGVHAVGSRSFRLWAGYWPTSTHPMAAPMNDIPKVVFSKTLNSATWAETRIAGGPLEEEIESIKARPGGYVIAYGGARFARALIRGGLVDEYRLNIQPAALGTGMPIFTELREPLKLELVEARAFAGGNVGHVYKPRSS